MTHTPEQIEAAQQICAVAAQQALWLKGDLSWKLRPEQVLLKAELEHPDIEVAVFNICRRLGKTFTLVLFCIEQCLKYKQKIRYGCAFLSDLEEFVLPAFYYIIEDCPEDLLPQYLRSHKTIIFKNGSEIKLVGVDKNPNGLRGNAIAKIIIDEAGFVANLKKIYVSVIIPATAKQKNIKLIFSSTPPETPDHFFIELCDKSQAQSNGLYKELTIDDISDLDPKERKRLLEEIGGEDSIAAQREFFCKLIVDQTIALTPEFRTTSVKEPEIPEFIFYWVSGDTGIVRDFNVFHLWGYDFKRAKFLCLDEVWFKPETDTDIIIKAIRNMEGSRRVDRFIDADARLRLDFAKDHNNFASNLPRKDELEATVNQVRVELKKNSVEISPKCKLLIATLKTGTFNKKRTDLARSENLGHMDAFMSFAYGLRHANTANPYPLYGGANHYTHYIDESKGDNRAKDSFKSIFRIKR